MRYLSIFKGEERDLRPGEVEEMGKLIEEQSKAGKLLQTEGCLPTATGVRVQRSGTDTKVTDDQVNRYVEAVELILQVS